MGLKVSDVLYYIIHIEEARSMIQWSTWHNPVHERNYEKDSETFKRCLHFLDETSRSFSSVIKELHPELLVPVTLFYLILRGLDTIEDDMTLPLETKEPLLRNFDTIIEKDGWNFDGNGPDEKDRQLLVEFQCVITEFKQIKPEYRKIIVDITKQMGNGMADYANNAEHNANGVQTIKDYDLYCHYVAGLVGEGLSRLFVGGELANPILLQRSYLHESMGLFLQKTNIIRDIHEDFEDKRRFWPKEIWSRHVDNFEDLFKPEHLDAALNCSSDIVLNALEHVEDCILYLAGLKEQSVFNFACIPQTMAIATLDHVFRNPNIFKKNVKISKGCAAQIMIESTQNLRVAVGVFRRFLRQLHKKNTPKDPNFLKISIACGRIEQYIESLFPSVRLQALVQQKPGGSVAKATIPKTPAEEAASQEANWDMFYMTAAALGTLFFISMLMVGIAWAMGARFDVMFSQVRQGIFSKPEPTTVEKLIKNYDHGEL